VDQYIRELFRDELPDGIKYHDADLDNLGREDFFKLDGKLRQGRRARGIDVSDDAKWYRSTLEIMWISFTYMHFCDFSCSLNVSATG
jgi:hypothetical protein